MAFRNTAIALVAIGQVLWLSACGPDFLADEVKTFSDATKKGSDAVERASDTFGITEGALTLNSIANKGQALTFSPVACRTSPTIETCRIATASGKTPLVAAANSEKLVVVQYFSLIAKYSDGLAKLMETKNTDALDGLEKSVSSTIAAISAITKMSGPIGAAATTVFFEAAKAVDDAARLARVRQAILAAQVPIRDATAFVTGYPGADGKPTKTSLMTEFGRTIVDGAVTDLNNHVRNYNVIPRTDAFASQRRLALDDIVVRQKGVAQLQAVDLQQLALDTLAAHEDLANAAREGRMSTKELMSAVEVLYKRASTIKDAIDKATGK